MGVINNSQARFGTTRWSVILTAARGNDPGSRQAIDQLCVKYWYPVYAFIRRQDRSRTPHDAEDLTQGFFADLLRRDWLERVGPEKGKFRTFLLACLGHYLSHVRDHQAAVRRSPAQPLLSIDAQNADERYRREPADPRDPAMLFDRRLAYALIESVLNLLRDEYHADGKPAVFDLLREHLVGEAERGSYTDTAARLGMSEGAVRVAVARLRERFRERLRAEVARTVEDPRDVDGEIRYLFELSR